MVASRTRDPTNGLRRFISDLRASQDRRTWSDRRSADRRAETTAVEHDRRVTDRRSDQDRRVVLTDRRRRIVETYSLEDAEQICEMVMHDEREAACPACDGNLLLGPVEVCDEIAQREVHCTECRRCLVLTDLPSELHEIG